MNVWCDRDGDFLEVTFEDARAVTDEIADDVFERCAADGRVVGMVVFNFSQHDRDAMTLPLDVTAIPIP